jgi:hypothetical protein
VAEQKLFVIYLEQRMRASQGTFHANPDYDFMVRLERDAAGSDRDQRAGSGDKAQPGKRRPGRRS